MSNRLRGESSPYLLQHKDNPVDWYPWGEEAFEKAKTENKPIFLSVGYSTCHWCHVMERESFENTEIAAMLNKDFISIKVDREERPDVDSIYMTFVQRMTGNGGWPMTLFLTPDLVPFFAGTYFPPTPKYGVPSFPDLVTRIAELWETERDALIGDSKKIQEAVLARKGSKEEDEITMEALKETFMGLSAGEDKTYGGFGAQPKFPTPTLSIFLHRWGIYAGEKKAFQLVNNQLDGMIRGGLWDHVGGGFARYSVDKKWEIPHFEKMLYDNALIAMVLLESYAVERNPLYREILEKLFRFIQREMTDKNGMFYSAQDADSEGEEGKFQLFDEEEIRQILGKDADAFFDFFPFTNTGNFEGKTHLNLIGNDDWKDEETRKEIDPLLDRIYDAREKRIHPFLDDKILTAWNGMMIQAYALAGNVLEDQEYTKRAERAAGSLLERHVQDGNLLGSRRDGINGPVGNLEDVAWLVGGMIALYESSLDSQWLEAAEKWCRYMTEHFLGEDGGFYLTMETVEHLLYRPRELYDGAVPSAIAVAVMNLIKIARLTQKEEFLSVADRQLELFGGEVASSPQVHTWMLAAYLLRTTDGKDLKLAGVTREDALEWSQTFRSQFHPYDFIILEDGQESTLQICRQGTCLMPVAGREAIQAAWKDAGGGLYEI